MPYLEICDNSGDLFPWTYATVLAAMTYPGADETAQREMTVEGLILRGINNTISPNITRMSAADRKQLHEIEMIAYRNLYRAGIGPDAAEKQASRRASEGMLAGLILRCLLRCAKHSPERASLNKAHHFVNTLYKRATKSGTEIKIGFSDPLLTKYRKRHAADCHLHAAVAACEIAGIKDWISCENIPTFLEISEVYRLAGEAKGFLDPSLTWRPPSHLISDLPMEILEYLVPPLNAAEIAILDDYTAAW